MNKIKMFITLLFFSFLFACDDNIDEETEPAEYNIDFEFTFDAPQKYYYYDFETRIFLSPTRIWYINEIITNWQTGDPSEGDIVKYTADKLKEECNYIIILYARETFEDSEETLKNKYPKHYNTFVENGFLISKNRSELDEIRLKHKIAAFNSNRNFRLMVYPSQDCNLKCWYCYETHVANTKMNTSVQENIVKFVENKLQNKEIESFTLSFFGGEPLLFFDEIAFPLSLKIKELCKKYNVLFTTFFVTNGTLIDEELIKKVKLINPVFQITLDGNKTKHDKVRIGKNNNMPTYDRIIKSLYLISNNISSHIDDMLVTLRINYDNQTLKDIDELVNDIKDVTSNFESSKIGKVKST